VSSSPLVSVIIPTHNRAARLTASLDALARQRWPAEALEAIIVADGCTDATADVVAAWRPPFAVRFIEQPASGPAVARNRGAAEARGRYLLFLDDDIRASPGLVASHMEKHGGEARQVIIGYLPAQVPGRDFFSIALRGWWDAMFQSMWKPGHRFTFRNLLSGNFSLTRELFETVGGFETQLRCHEDYELGLRLLEAGASFRFSPRALGFHDERTDLATALRRKFEEGRADIWLIRRRPQMLDVVPLKQIDIYSSRRRRLLCWLAGRAPRAGDALAWLLRQRLGFYEHLRLRYRWRALLEDLLVYWYWRGLIAEAGTGEVQRLRCFPAARAAALIDVDLAEGLEAAEQRLNRERPAAVRLRHGVHVIGELEESPGAEALRGAHLRPLLAERFIDGYTRAVAIAGELPPVVDVERVLAELRPPADTPAGQARVAT
jgi:glycosyltransferase involved in cell wall biosynthesis